MTKRIGLFGGSFDPVHHAHLALGRQALAELQLDELRWVPVGHAWQKARQLTPAAQREAMLRLAIDGEPRFVLERCELRTAGSELHAGDGAGAAGSAARQRSGSW